MISLFWYIGEEGENALHVATLGWLKILHRFGNQNQTTQQSYPRDLSASAYVQEKSKLTKATQISDNDEMHS
jgi:hypothetical protein